MKISVKAIVAAIVVGLALVLGFAAIFGSRFPAPPFPFMAMLSGFILSGLIVGFLSEGETVVEPGVASIITAAISYPLVASFELKAFGGLSDAQFHINMLLVMLNGVALTFVGAWAGEKLQRTYELAEGDQSRFIEWGWIISAAVVGLAVSMLFVNIVFWIGGWSMGLFLVAVAVGLFFSGLVVGWRSPGVTIVEPAFAGFVTVMIEIDVFKITLDPNTTQFTSPYAVVGVLALGLVAALVGGVVGERLQSKQETKRM